MHSSIIAALVADFGQPGQSLFAPSCSCSYKRAEIRGYRPDAAALVEFDLDPAVGTP